MTDMTSIRISVFENEREQKVFEAIKFAAVNSWPAQREIGHH